MVVKFLMTNGLRRGCNLFARKVNDGDRDREISQQVLGILSNIVVKFEKLALLNLRLYDALPFGHYVTISIHPSRHPEVALNSFGSSSAGNAL